jgi:hypothetical protein
LLAAGADPQAGKYFRITIVDDATGRGVPLVELTTVNGIQLVTDSRGIAAFHEPGLMGQRVFFHIESHGYEFPKDGFGFRGKAFDVTEGGQAEASIKRLNVAERLYRVTGGGIYRDSLLVGEEAPIERPLLNARVFGSDSVVTALYHGKLWWFWGDTNRPAYPLGNFHVPGATSELPGQGGLDPEVGVNLRYFEDDQGFARPMARMPGEGPTWIVSLIPLAGADGRQRLFASYVKVKGLLDVYARGLAELDDASQEFKPIAEFAMDRPLYPEGHPLRHSVDGVDYLYFARPFPLVRVPANPDDLVNLDRYETFSCLAEGSRLDGRRPAETKLDRDPAGRLRWGWKRNTPAAGPGLQRQLITAGLIRRDEALTLLRDADTSKEVVAHSGSVYFNAHRRRWVMIAVESGSLRTGPDKSGSLRTGGTSLLGEVWFAEADTPLGPWVYARKVVTHDKYSFYNPKQHPQFDKQDGRVIFFEGTYTHTFSGNPERTPRYDYNQVMYKLDLDDERLALPVAVYDLAEPGSPSRLVLPSEPARLNQPWRVAFFALDRLRSESIGVYPLGSGRLKALNRAPDEAAAPLFYALPAALENPPAGTVPLHEYVHEDGAQRIYSTDRKLERDGYSRADQPVCRVWNHPSQVEQPRE